MIGVVTPNWFDRSALEALEVAEHAERLGFDELWIGEMMTTDAFGLAAAIASNTRRIPLWVGPLAVGVRDPVSLAMGVTTVSAIGGRPAHLALGASNPTVVAGWHGRAWSDPATRTRETVREVRSLLAGERSDGGFRLRMDGSGSSIAVAAFGPRMVAAAGDVADRVVLNLVTPAQVAAISTSRPKTVWVAAALHPGEAAIRQLSSQLVAYVGAPGYGEAFTSAGFGDVVALARSGATPKEVVAAVPRELIEAVAALGDAGAITARVAQYESAGAHVAIVPVTAEDPGGEKVLTALAPRRQP